MKVEGIAQLNKETREYFFDELALARLTSSEIVNLINSIVGGLPLEYFGIDQVSEFVTVDIVFLDTALSILYNTTTKEMTHEQMGFETIKRLLKEGAFDNV